MRRAAASSVCAVLFGVSLLASSPPGSARARPAPPDDLRISPFDTLGSPDKAKMDSLKARFSRGRYTGRFTGLVFTSPMADTEAGGETVESEDPFLPYAGMIIRDISITRYDVVGNHPVGVDAPEDRWFTRLINGAHIDTRLWKIRGFLLMKPGEPLDPFALSDTERLLRETPFIQDARVIVHPVPGVPDSVDIVVATRDVWSIGVNVSVPSYDRYGVKINERNLAGIGHTLGYEADMDLSRDRMTDHTTRYRAFNILGSFVDGEIRYVDSNEEIANRWELSRGYVSPEIRWTGGLAVDGVKVRESAGLAVVRQYDREDVWVGRSIGLGRRPAGGASRRRIIPAVRVTRYDYTLRPPATSRDLFRGYHDRLTFLARTTLTDRSFRTSRYIFSFGTSEDIPEGFLVSASGGYQEGEFLKRGYAGAEASFGLFDPRLGYIAANMQAGSYFRKNASEDGAAGLIIGGYSRLVRFAGGAYRHFAVISYLLGFNRLPDDTVFLERKSGEFYGLGGVLPGGRQRLTLEYEGIYFMPVDWYGFRFALFAFAQAAEVGPDWHSFIGGKYWSSLGGGLRFHNERLIFNAIEVRLMHHPAVPEGADSDWFRFGAVRSLEIPFLSPTAPSIVKYE